MMIIFLVLIVMVLYYVLNNHKKVNDVYKQGSTAEDLLKMRYANGEIDDETYKKMKELIKY